MLNPIISTVSSLFPSDKLSTHSTSAVYFDTSNLSLVRNGAPAPSEKVKGKIKALVEAAEEAATSLACSSILAGQGSESDEHGDVGIWLGDGPYGEGQEHEVLKALDLLHWAGGEKVIAVELQLPNSLPSTLSANLDFQVSVDKFAKLLSSFTQKHCFCVKQGSIRSGLVAFFLLGKLDGEDGWGGLVGVGVWADE